MTPQRPLILFTNDDGILSPGLWTVAEAFADMADILIVAPINQQSGTGRSLPSSSTGAIVPQEGKLLPAFAVDGTPAQAVQHGIMEIATRRPDLVISGINYGENTGNGVTISGTVGASLEAASFGIPSIAVSQQTDHNQHLSYSKLVDFTVAAQFTRRFAEWMLGSRLPSDVDLLKLDVPMGATLDTEWRMTRLSKKRVYWPTVPDRTTSYSPQTLGYTMTLDARDAEPDSDVYAVFVDKVISLTPISLDMTARIDLAELRTSINGSVSHM
ncbi:MAG: 5'/3'-nucleotidase SurE [Phototrophicaceae bacterium]|jgi:5'-nucleotidase